ncbi:sigma factor [Lacticaseibacillus daqingensis]|uniref:sigma factor n=1 Tax=Lacticaseibacillus daqingensis TaxID=2486014 RepID=UPI000F7B1388|nr:sigma factor [Lacticaseibacillus daqingensis]
MNEAELALIRAAMAESGAFEQLFHQYLPLVGSVIKQFYLVGFERDDWLQEARIAMLKTVGRFDGSRGSKFGPYYRLVLTSHYRSLVRRQMAQKRRIDTTAMLVADPRVDSLAYSLSHAEREREMIFVMEADRFFSTLSPLELATLQAHLTGLIDHQSAVQQRAMARVQHKYLAYLDQLSAD